MSPQVLQYSGRMGLEPSRRLGHLPVQPVSRQYLMCKVSRSFPVFVVPTDSSVTLSTLKQCTMAETRPPISSVNKDWHHYVFWLRDTNTGSSSDTLSPKIEEFCASPSLNRHAHRQPAFPVRTSISLSTSSDESKLVSQCPIYITSNTHNSVFFFLFSKENEPLLKTESQTSVRINNIVC